MKIGDLVMYADPHVAGSGPVEGHEGLILDGPHLARDGVNRWEVFWMYCNKTGWWDEFRLGVIDEGR